MVIYRTIAGITERLQTSQILSCEQLDMYPQGRHPVSIRFVAICAWMQPHRHQRSVIIWSGGICWCTPFTIYGAAARCQGRRLCLLALR